MAGGSATRTVGNPIAACAFLLGVALWSSAAFAGPLDEMALDRWAKLREVERYQLQVAERYYKQGNWKAAISEYEKFLSLYEKSDGASFAQLKWGLCQVQLRKANTAIKDGFQSVLDYWPDSPDAVLARYHIGRTWKDMGQTEKAKKAYEALLKDHIGHPAAAYTLADLIDVAQTGKDFKLRADCWKKLTFEVKRTEGLDRVCRDAAKQYAQWCFSEGAFEDGANALATNYKAAELFARTATYLAPPLGQMAAEAETRPKAERLASQAIEWLRGQAPTAVSAPEQKELLRKVLLAVAEIHAAALQDAKAAEVYDEIVRRCGVSDETLGRLAAWHESRTKFDEAYKVYRRYENKADGLARIAGSYRLRRLYPAAVNAYNELIAADAKNQFRWTAEIAATHRLAGQYGEAIRVYRELIKNDPTNSPEWLWMIGISHRDAGQWKEAIGVLRQCTNFPENLKVMAACHRRLRQYAEALLLYNQIAGDEPSAPWAALEIAATWEEAGKNEEAIKAFQQVCKKFPKSPQASSAHARLQDVYKISVTLGGATDE